MTDKQIYKVAFVFNEQIYELFVAKVYQSDLYGFVVIEDFIFGKNSSIVVDPAEEKLKTEFEGVKRSFIPMHEVLRIDQVERRGAAKILPLPTGGKPAKSTNPYSPEK